MAREGAGRSRLVPLGFALMILGVAFPRALSSAMEGLEPGLLRSAVSVVIQLLYVGFLVGLVAAIVGIVRNRRLLKP